MERLSTRSLHRIIRLSCCMVVMLAATVFANDVHRFREQPFFDVFHKTAPSIPEKKAQENLPDLSKYLRIVSTNVFGTNDSLRSEEIDLNALPQSDSSSGLRLMGAVVNENAGARVAFVFDAKEGKQMVLHEGDEIRGIRIRRIFMSQIVINKEGKDEILALNKG